MEESRRRHVLLPIILAGVGLIALVVKYYRQIMAVTIRHIMPPSIEEPDSVVDAGPISRYQQPGVYTDLTESHGVWIVHEANGMLFALRAICTHLGCTPGWEPGSSKFVCPCHGSEYDTAGVNIAGPSKRPLERLKITRADERLRVDRDVVFREELGQWGHSDAFIDLSSKSD